MNTIFQNFMDQFQIMVNCLPFTATEESLLLKGGTAINLYYRNFPRISVDIDLVYQLIEERMLSLNKIDSALNRISQRICLNVPGFKPKVTYRKDRTVNKIWVGFEDTEIKIEYSPVLRGVVYPPSKMKLQPNVPFENKDFELNVASEEDVYAGKFMAALDRQHPRDLFDVHEFFDKKEISPELRNAFIVYFLSDNRSPEEMLAPNRKDIEATYNSQLQGMMNQKKTISELLDAREQLISDLVGNMPDNHKEFIMSFYRGKPEWSLMEIPDIDKFPAVRWKMINLEKNFRREKRLYTQGN